MSKPDENDLDPIYDKLGEAISKINSIADCDDKCQLDKTNSELRSDYNNALDEYLNGKTKIEDAKKKWLVSEYGENEYNKIKENEYNEEIKDLIDNYKNAHTQIVIDINDKINEYENTIIFYNKLKQLLIRIKDENNTFNQNIDEYNKIVNTSDRKTFYEDETISRVSRWEYLLKIVYFILLSMLSIRLLYFRKEYKNYNVVVKLVILLIIPIYGLKYLKNIFIYIYSKIKLFYESYIKYDYLHI
jgi:hypothetical protein